MKHTFLYLMTSLLAIAASCTSTPKDTGGDIQAINLDQDFQSVNLDIHELGEVEYILPETTDSSLIGDINFFINDKYIVTDEGVFGGKRVLFFDRKTGKSIGGFDKSGTGPQEYRKLYLKTVDFDAEECFIYDINQSNPFKMLVYSFQGEFKRSFSLGGYNIIDPNKMEITGKTFTDIINYNKDFLLGYNNFENPLKRTFNDKHPYYLISKKDGQLIPLGIQPEQRLSYIELDPANNKDAIGSFYYHAFVRNGNEVWIKDLSSDTIYSCSGRDVKPILLQAPSMKQDQSPTVIEPVINTDSYFFFFAATLQRNPYRPDHLADMEREAMIWDKKTKEIKILEGLHNSDITVPKGKAVPLNQSASSLPKNCFSLVYTPDYLLQLYKANKLKGKLKEVASKIQSEEDNDIIVLIKTPTR